MYAIRRIVIAGLFALGIAIALPAAAELATAGQVSGGSGTSSVILADTPWDPDATDTPWE